MKLRKRMREMAYYLLPPKLRRDDEIVDSYTDTMVLIAKKYHKKQVKKCSIPDVSGSDYRIVEYCGEYEIQGYQLNKHTNEKEWEYIDKYGKCIFIYPATPYIVHVPRLQKFITLSDAEEMLTLILEGHKYHYR